MEDSVVSLRKSALVFANRESASSPSLQYRPCLRHLKKKMRRRSGGERVSWLDAALLVGFIWGWILILENFSLLNRLMTSIAIFFLCFLTITWSIINYYIFCRFRLQPVVLLRRKRRWGLDLNFTFTCTISFLFGYFWRILVILDG